MWLKRINQSAKNRILKKCRFVHTTGVQTTFRGCLLFSKEVKVIINVLRQS